MADSPPTGVRVSTGVTFMHDGWHVLVRISTYVEGVLIKYEDKVTPDPERNEAAAEAAAERVAASLREALATMSPITAIGPQDG